jgi:hypothetical protein
MFRCFDNSQNVKVPDGMRRAAREGVVRWTDREAEEIFFNKPLIIGRSLKGEPEIRYGAGKKGSGKAPG